MKKPKPNEKKLVEKYARESVKQLFEEAVKLADNKLIEQADKCLKQAIRTARKNNIRISNINKDFKRLYCRKCEKILIPNKTSRVRLAKQRIITTCLNCDHVMRYPYSKEKKSRRVKDKVYV